MKETPPRHEVSWSARVDTALRFAAAAHHEDVRKGTQIPYVMHPFYVGLILDRHGFSEDVVIAGILHDVLEDPHYEAESVQLRLRAVFPELASAPFHEQAFPEAVVACLATRFGEVAMDLIGHVTEKKFDEAGKERAWETRKAEQLAALAGASREQCAVKAADCLHNLRSMSHDIRVDGVEIMKRFKKEAAGARWYNARATALVAQRLGDTHPLSVELCNAFHECEGLLVSSGAVGDNTRDAWSGELSASEDLLTSEDGGLWVYGRLRRRIHGFGHWLSTAPPKEGARQWQDGASAKELARVWTRGGQPAVPEEVRRLFDSHGLTVGLELATAFAEHVTSLPVAPDREGRNHDLLALGLAAGRKIVVGIEAKAAEPLGPEVGPYRSRAESKNRALRPDGRGVVDEARRSLIPDRIRDCAMRVFGNASPEGLDGLRYQLLHATAATVIEAERRGAECAIFLVQQFSGEGINESCVESNRQAIEDFIRLLSKDSDLRFESGRLYGPFISGARTPHGRGVDLLVGEAVSPLSWKAAVEPKSRSEGL